MFALPIHQPMEWWHLYLEAPLFAALLTVTLTVLNSANVRRPPTSKSAQFLLYFVFQLVQPIRPHKSLTFTETLLHNTVNATPTLLYQFRKPIQLQLQ